MSKISFRPRGGEEGIDVSTTELTDFARALNFKFIDQVIPLPGVSKTEQKQRINSCKKDHDQMEDAMYYETEKGSHGWCCSYCGEVLQWG